MPQPKPYAILHASVETVRLVSSGHLRACSTYILLGFAALNLFGSQAIADSTASEVGIRSQYQCVMNLADAEEENSFGQDIQSVVDSHLPIEIDARELLLQADSAIYDGNVDVRRGSLHLQADRASLNLESSDIQLLGDVGIVLPGAELEGESASINLETNASIIKDARYFIDAAPDISGAAGSVEFDQQRRVTVLDGSYTRCNPKAKEWEVEARKIVLDPDNGQGVAQGALIRVFDRPLVYVPYMRFPVGDQRQSGFLFPEIASRSEGIDLATPYYFNLAPNYDLLLTPRYRAGHGFITGLKGRWLNGFDRWEASTLFIDSDDARQGDSRWLLSLSENSEWSGDIITELDITRASDSDVPRDLQSNNFAVTRSSSLVRRGKVEWLHKLGTAGVFLEQFQSVDPTLRISNEKLPEAWATMSLRAPGGAVLYTDMRYTAFDNADLGLVGGLAGTDDEVQRSAGLVDLVYPLRTLGGRFDLSIGNEFRYYELEQADASLLDGSDADWIHVVSGGVKWSAELWRDRERGAEELLQPELSYTWRELESGADSLLQLPQLDGFRASAAIDDLYAGSSVGGDLLEARDQARVALRYARYEQSDDTLDDYADSSLGLRGSLVLGATHFAKRELMGDRGTLPMARHWFAGGDWRINKSLRSNAELVWSNDDSEFSLASVALRYHPRTLRAARKPVVNIAYHQRADQNRFENAEPIEQVDLSGAFPVDANWALYGRVLYDLENSVHSEALAGFEFNDCCFKVRLVYRDGLVYRPLNSRAARDRTVMLQLQLKGLGGIGGGIEDLLEQSIRGFRPR